MTTSTCSTVSAEELQHFIAQKAQELGLTHLLAAEAWAVPTAQSLPAPQPITGFRNGQIRMRNDRTKKQ